MFIIAMHCSSITSELLPYSNAFFRRLSRLTWLFGTKLTNIESSRLSRGMRRGCDSMLNQSFLTTRH